MALVSSFDPAINFWVANPQLKLVGKFKQLHDSDKSKNKDKSSLLMYFVANCYDRDSKFEPIETNEKHKIIGKDICKDEFFFENNKTDLEGAIKFYIKIDDNTAARRQHRALNRKLDQRTEFLDSVDYTLDNADQLDKLLANSKKLFDDYARITEELAKEDNNSSGKGDRELSLSDLGRI